MKPTSRLSRLRPALFLALCLAGWQPCPAVDLSISLDPTLDQFGTQIETVQAYQQGGVARATMGLYDTGASVVTFSATDQFIFEFVGSPIPIKVPGGADASGIGGSLQGDVSQPGTILADGPHAVDFSGFSLLNPFPTYNMSQAVSVPNVQAFVGNFQRSAALPTLTGTPIDNATPGRAAKISMAGYQLDLGALLPELPELKGVFLPMPDLHFVAPNDPNTPLKGAAGTLYGPVRVPLAFFGPNNYSNPGNSVTASPNPVQSGVGLSAPNAANPANPLRVSGQTFLFDTGAQLSVISPTTAMALGLDLNRPETTISVQGAAGTPVDVSGFTLSTLELPLDDNGDGTSDGKLTFQRVPVYVLDLGINGLDGILGMNLFNTANEMLYDPTGSAPYLSLTFLANLSRTPPSSGETTGLSLLAGSGLFPAFSKNVLPAWGFRATAVPEPATLLMLAAGATLLLCRRCCRGARRARAA